MECRDIQNKLSAYLESLVSSEEKALIEAHLNSCPACSADLADLRKTLELIRGLEEVEPPEWMAQKIMTRVREESRQEKGILQKLFYPLHVKLPLEAVAALLVVGLTLYIYRDIKPEMRLAKAPAEESAPQTLQREIVKEDKIGPIRKSEEKNVPQEVTIAPAKPSGESAPGKIEAKDRSEPAPKAPQPHKQEELMFEQRKAPAPAVAGAARPATGALQDEAKPEAAQATPKLKALSEGKMERMILTVRVRQIEKASKETERIVAALGGKIIETRSLDGRRIFTAELNAGRLNELFEKLKPVGDVGEKALSLKGHEGNIRVRIEIVEEQQGVQ